MDEEIILYDFKKPINFAKLESYTPTKEELIIFIHYLSIKSEKKRQIMRDLMPTVFTKIFMWLWESGYKGGMDFTFEEFEDVT